jgi:hypothetical protein
VDITPNYWPAYSRRKLSPSKGESFTWGNSTCGNAILIGSS